MNKQLSEKQAELRALQEQIGNARERLQQLRHELALGEVSDYTLTNTGGHEVALSDLFGTKDDLILVHNMGKGCVYCTLWADGFNGLSGHLADRAAPGVVG